MAWAKETDPAKAPSVYWLTGLAGLGKTTIAYTICELLEEARVPFTSFFCSRQLDSKNSKLLITTLCRNLAELFSSYALAVLPILESNSSIVDTKLCQQMDELLVKPWKASLDRRERLQVPVVIVDALDENDHGTNFLEELLRVIESGKLTGIKFLVTSRPEPILVNMCKSFPENAVCKLHEVDTANVQKDIKRYLCEALPDLKDDPNLAVLAHKAGGLFIYATTAVRFISPHPPLSIREKSEQLQSMLSSWPISDGRDGRLAVDDLYDQILGVAFGDDRVRHKRLQILHTVLCAEIRINMSVLADLSDTDQDTVKRVMDSLHAVLFTSPKDNCVYWYHASFPDFLFDEGRAKLQISLYPNYPTHEINVFCDSSAHHAILAHQCFSIMLKFLHFNMCGLESSYVFDSDVSELSHRKDKNITSTLRYASQCWAKHLFKAVPAKDNTNDLLLCLNKFMSDKLLFWIEAMNLIGAVLECSPLLKDAKNWLNRERNTLSITKENFISMAFQGKQQSDLMQYLEDAANFSTFFSGSPAAKSTPHLYISALSTWYQQSPVWAHWKHQFACIPSISLRHAIIVPLLTITTKGRISCVALSGHGDLIASGSWDHFFVEVWDAKTGKQLRELKGHINNVRSVAFSLDGNQIVSGSTDGSVQVWDAKTGEQLRELQGHANNVNSVAFSPDGNQIVSGSADQSVWVWDAKTGDQLMELQCHTKIVTSVAFSPDGKKIVSGSAESVKVWDAKTGEQLRELQGHTKYVYSVAFSPDNNQIISGSADRSVRVWDAKTGKQLRELQGHTYYVSSVAFSPDGNQIISGSADKSVRVWDTKTGEQLRELQGHTDIVNSVTFSPDGNHIVSSSEDQSVWVWDAKTSEQLRELQGHTKPVTSVAFSSDGNEIVSGSADQSVRVWDAKTGEQLRELQGHTNIVNSVAFSPDDNQIVSGSADHSVWVWDAKTGEQLRELQGHTYYVYSVAFSPDGNQIVSGSADQSVQVWDAKTGKQLRKLQGHTNIVNSVAFSPEGNQIVSGSADQSVRVWDAKAGEQLMKLRGHTNIVTSVAFSPDGNQIVSGSADQSVRVWDARTGEQLRKLQGHTNEVNSVDFSPNGNQIVSGSADQSVRVWDAKTGEQLRELQGHTHYVYSVAFSHDGNHIVSCSGDHSVRVWDTKTGVQLRELQGHTSYVESVDFSPDSNQIVSGSGHQSQHVKSGIDSSCVVNTDGWILSDTKHLIWIPPTIHNVLHHPYNTLIISQNGSATISFANSNLGKSWHECYTP